MKRALILPALLLIGCSAISTLQAVVDSTAAAIPIFQAAGVNIPAVAVTYVNDVAQCVAGQNGATTPTDAQLLAIAGCLGTKVAPTLPPGTASTIVSIISSVVNDVAAFLAQHPAPMPTLTSARSHLSTSDSTKLKLMESKAASTINQLAPFKPKVN